MDWDDFAREMTRQKRHSFKFTVKDRVTGLAVDITSWPKFWVTLKTSPSETDAEALCQITLTATSAGVITKANPSAGVCNVDMESPATTDAPNVRSVYLADIQGQDSDLDPWNLARGQFTIFPEVTEADV